MPAPENQPHDNSPESESALQTPPGALEQPRFAEGNRIGHYTVLSLVGRGGMGEIYLVRDELLGRKAALKVLPAGAGADPGRRQRLIQEARAASALNHPSIVVIYEVGSDRGVDFVVMEHVAGSVLNKMIPPNGLPLRTALNYGVQIADALSAAHAAGIIHRDLKPSNVMITEHGSVKVLDFGLAKLAKAETADSREATATQLTRPGAVMGTASYMAPEQARGQRADSRSDIFAFGCVLYEMVTGRMAFEGDCDAARVAAVLRDEPKPLRSSVKGIPPELESIIQRCLRKDPARRFQRIEDVRLELQQVAHSLPASARRQWRRAEVVFGGLAILGALAGGFMFWRASRMPSATTSMGPPEPITTYRGIEEDATLSPDGREVAFSANIEASDNFDIYVKVIGAEPALRLTRDPGMDEQPMWSPDGRWIAFTRGWRNLLLVSPLGGPEKLLATEPEPVGLRVVGWTPDSQSVIAEATAPRSGESPYFVVSLSSGERRPLHWPARLWYPSLSADGRKLAYTITGATPTRFFIASLTSELEMARPTEIYTTEFESGGRCAWTPNGRDLICPLRKPGAEAALFRIHAGGSALAQAVPAGQGAWAPVISAAGDRLVFEKAGADYDIWRVANPLRNSAAIPAQRVASSTSRDISPQYSPDGTRIAFCSNRSGAYEIWLAAFDGSQPRMLTSFGVAAGPAWSPDGQSIIFIHNGEIYSVDGGGGLPQRRGASPPIKNTESKWWTPTYSRDGRWIYFTSDGTGREEIWRLPAAGGAAIQITNDGGAEPLESPDGRWLLYVRDDGEGYGIWRMPVRGGAAQRLLQSPVHAFRSAPQFAFGARDLYCIRHDYTIKPRVIERVDLASGATTRVRMISPWQRADIAGRGFSVSPDGHWFLYAEFQYESDLMQIRNFR